MRIEHLDKALRPGGTKHPGQDYFDRRTAALALTHDQIHETGRAIAKAAEEATRPHYLDGMKRIADPTKDEAAELAAAIAELEPLRVATSKARLNATITRELADQEAAAGYWEQHPDPKEVARRRAEVEKADRAFDRAVEDERRAEKRVEAARGAIAANGAWRQRVFVANGGLDR